MSMLTLCGSSKRFSFTMSQTVFHVVHVLNLLLYKEHSLPVTDSVKYQLTIIILIPVPWICSS